MITVQITRVGGSTGAVVPVADKHEARAMARDASRLPSVGYVTVRLPRHGGTVCEYWQDGHVVSVPE